LWPYLFRAACEKDHNITPAPKITLITGAGSGIGRAVALALLARGDRVILAGRRMDRLEETARLAEGMPGEALAAACDVADGEAVEALFRLIVETHGRLDMVFNNAGVPGPPARFEDVTLAQWERVVAVNLTGAFLVAQGAYRVMKAQSPQGGRIINNGSISATTPRVHSAPYTATKHAITGLTKSLSLDGRAYNIVCGQIDIGNAQTDMTAYSRRGALQASGHTIEEPMMSVDHVAEAVAYMSSLPLEANVQFMTVMASAMPFVGRG